MPFLRKIHNKTHLFIYLALAASITIIAATLVLPLINSSENTHSSLSASENPPTLLPQIATLEDKGHANNIIANHTISLAMEKGDTLSSLLDRAGINNADAFSAINTLQKVYNLKSMRTGQTLYIYYNQAPQNHSSTRYKLNRITLPTSLNEEIHVIAGNDGAFTAKKVVKPLTTRVIKAETTIHSSLFEDATNANIPANLIMELITAYSYDVDFQRDIRAGDHISLLYERKYAENGIDFRNGSIIFAALTLRGKTQTIYLHDYNGNKEFYTESGKTVSKALLRTPVNGARLSSGFGRRKHPVLGYTKMHKGVDFAAPRGTPIYASGDGTIKYIGRKGSYGNYIRIQHNNTYASAYAHAKKFAKGLRKGGRVKQGQIIAYIGTTGRSTGPHLHYEVLKYGKQMNPRKLKFPPRRSLKGEQLMAFNAYKESIDYLVATLETNMPTKVAALSDMQSHGL